MRSKVKTVFQYIGIIVLWVVVLLLALFPGRYINSLYGYAAFFLGILLILSLIILAVLRHSIGVESNLPRDAGALHCQRGDPVDLHLTIKNRSILFCSHAKAGFFISDFFGAVDKEMHTDFTLAPRSDSRFNFAMGMNHIDIYQVGLKEVKVYDLFGVFHRKVRIEGAYTICVSPRIRTMEDLIVDEENFLESGRGKKNPVPGGLDYVGVRDYEPGDPMKQIHWKLSAHAVSYLTRLSENARQSEFSVVLDFSARKADREEQMDLYDALVETAFSLLEELARQEATYSLVYLDKQGELRRSVPMGRETDMEYIRQFGRITPDPGPDYMDGAAIVHEEAGMPNRSTNLLVCSSRITPELVQELLSVKRQRRSPELYLIYPKRLTQQERENLAGSLRPLDEAKIPWHPVSTRRSRRKGDGSSVQPSDAFTMKSGEGET